VTRPSTSELGLEPEPVWERFLELTAIPRPSHEEHEARRYVLDRAERHGWEAATDEAGNVVVRVPASEGRETAPTVVLQAHLDMVCERDPDSPYDPREGRIHVVRDGDWLLAEGTTLGADNGIGVAAALAVAEDPAVEHGPIELLLTACEEQGLEGAKGLDPALVTGRTLVNLDGTSDGALTVGCAGSAHAFIRVAVNPGPVDGSWRGLRIDVTGGRGGHSGGDIHRGRANALKALGRVLERAAEVMTTRLAALDGGVSRNAIPREATAIVAVDGGENKLRAAVDDALIVLLREHVGEDDELSASVSPTPVDEAASTDVTARALALLGGLPTGVVSYAPGLEESVRTSSSVNVARTEDGVLTLASMTRSSSATELEEVVSSIEQRATESGAELEVVRSYPPWEPDFEAPLLTAARETYRGLFGVEPALEVVHGGLECAVLGAKLPGVQMISIGPTIHGPHAPGERLGISATERFYRLLGALLDDLSR
jgi:dipeptidase D